MCPRRYVNADVVLLSPATRGNIVRSGIDLFQATIGAVKTKCRQPVSWKGVIENRYAKVYVMLTTVDFEMAQICALRLIFAAVNA